MKQFYRLTYSNEVMGRLPHLTPPITKRLSEVGVMNEMKKLVNTKVNWTIKLEVIT